jgi:hypothetical protein
MVKKAGSGSKPGKTTAPAEPGDRPAAGADECRIRERAYHIWIEEGQPHGRDLAHWRRAHQELRGGGSVGASWFYFQSRLSAASSLVARCFAGPGLAG